MTDDALRHAILRAGARWDDRLLASGTGVAPRAEIGDDVRTWQRRLDPDDSGMFERRLAWSGLTWQTATQFLKPAAPTAQPKWWDTLTWMRAATNAATSTSDPVAWLEARESALPDTAEAVPYAHLWWPVVTEAWRRLKDVDGVEILGARAVEGTEIFLLMRIADVSTAALLHGQAAQRTAGQALMYSWGSHDTDPRSRAAYAEHCQREAGSGLTGVLTEFPVLGRLLATVVDQWQATMTELITRVAADAGVLSKAFGSSVPVQVDQLVMGAGDTHQQGRSVCHLTLAGPESPVRLVYKPRDLRMDAAYYPLAAWFIHGSSAPADVDVLARRDAQGQYGYTSFVEHAPANSSDLAAFYRNAGRLAALLHFLGTTDAHAENLIAHGTSLVLVDAETLFEGRLRDSQGYESSRSPRARDITTSVLRIGLFPRWRADVGAARAMDISALGAQPTVVGGSSYRRGWAAVNTDEMAWGVVRSESTPATSLPIVPGATHPLAAHVDDLVRGFVSAYRDAAEPAFRGELLTRVQAFRGLTRRVIVRPTTTYVSLLRRADSADSLRSANARAFELDRLARSALVADDQTVRWPLFLAEVRDLESLDVPYFSQALGSPNIRGTGVVIPDALVEDGLQQALRRIEQANDSDLEWQVALIKAAVAAHTVSGDTDAKGAARVQVGRLNAAPLTPSERESAVAQVLERILDDIEAESVDQEGRRTWLTLRPIGDGVQVQLDLMDAGLYSGASGLLAFLGELGARADSPNVRQRSLRIAAEGWNAIVSHLLEATSYESYRRLRNLGLGFSGVGGLLRALSIPTCALDDDRRAALQTRIVDAIGEGLAEGDRNLDFMSGTAGALGPVLDLVERRGLDHGWQVVRSMADRLLQTQNSSGGWVTPVAPQPLTGLSHGASGFAVALAQAAIGLRDGAYLDAALRALAYEREEFDPARGNWRDTRVARGQDAFMVAWCNGATGIALARSRLMELLPGHDESQRWQDELDVAIATTIAAEPTDRDHLCCGMAGRAALLSGLGTRHGDANAVATSAMITGDLIARSSLPNGLRLNDYSTGAGIGRASLMTGLAGVGLHLLCRDGDQSVVRLLI